MATEGIKLNVLLVFETWQSLFESKPTHDFFQKLGQALTDLKDGQAMWQTWFDSEEFMRQCRHTMKSLLGTIPRQIIPEWDFIPYVNKSLEDMKSEKSLPVIEPLLTSYGGIYDHTMARTFRTMLAWSCRIDILLPVWWMTVSDEESAKTRTTYTHMHLRKFWESHNHLLFRAKEANA